jgi:hypothetical protein
MNSIREVIGYFLSNNNGKTSIEQELAARGVAGVKPEEVAAIVSELQARGEMLMHKEKLAYVLEEMVELSNQGSLTYVANSMARTKITSIMKDIANADGKIDPNAAAYGYQYSQKGENNRRTGMVLVGLTSGDILKAHPTTLIHEFTHVLQEAIDPVTGQSFLYQALGGARYNQLMKFVEKEAQAKFKKDPTYNITTLRNEILASATEKWLQTTTAAPAVSQDTFKLLQSAVKGYLETATAKRDKSYAELWKGKGFNFVINNKAEVVDELPAEVMEAYDAMFSASTDPSDVVTMQMLENAGEQGRRAAAARQGQIESYRSEIDAALAVAPEGYRPLVFGGEGGTIGSFKRRGLAQKFGELAIERGVLAEGTEFVVRKGSDGMYRAYAPVEEAEANLQAAVLPQKIEGLDLSEKLNGIEDIAEYVDAQAKGYLQSKGIDTSKMTDEEVIDYTAERMVTDAEFALRMKNSGKDWYGADIRYMDMGLAAIFPSLSSKNKRVLFKGIIALTSFGNTPFSNESAAVRLFDASKQDFTQLLPRKPNGEGWSARAIPVAKGIERLNRLIKDKGENGAATWLLQKHPVSELKKYNAAVTTPRGAGKDYTQYGGMIFGDKGGPFFLNLNGIEQMLTMDLWFSRSWNRYLGTLKLAKPVAKYNKAKEIIGFDHTQDVPRNDSERALMVKAATNAVDRLNEQNPRLDIKVRDLQAVLWYYEQRVYTALGSPSESGSYKDATRRILESGGFDSPRSLRAYRDSQEGGADADFRSITESRKRELGIPKYKQFIWVDTGDNDEFNLQSPVGRDGGRRGGNSLGELAPLAGTPNVKGATGPDRGIHEVAAQYARENNIPRRRQSEYVEVNEDFAKRIAAAYEAMPHAPRDPVVKEAYGELIKQTVAQYKALEKAGYKFWLFDNNNDPYEGKPWRAMVDLRQNKSMGVYSTLDGYGSGELATDVNSNIEEFPLLAKTGVMWPSGSPNGPMVEVTANDLFRAVHDVFGHGTEGAGFRAQGEENAWQAHVRLFTGSAIKALTTETRGQNSWLNYGPSGEANQTATTEGTQFAEQKIGLLPDWAHTENIAPDEVLEESQMNLQGQVLESYNDVKDRVSKKFQPLAKKLNVEIVPNVTGHIARYVWSSPNGNHFIEYNPNKMKGMSVGEFDATFREEFIHAASGAVLRKRGDDWSRFYGILAMDMTIVQRATTKQIYRSAKSDVAIGAEYFRMAVQKLLYNTVTEAEVRTTAMQKILDLLKDVVDFFRNGLKGNPQAKDVFRDTVRMLRVADKNNVSNPDAWNLQALSPVNIERAATYKKNGFTLADEDTIAKRMKKHLKSLIHIIDNNIKDLWIAPDGRMAPVRDPRGDGFETHGDVIRMIFGTKENGPKSWGEAYDVAFDAGWLRVEGASGRSIHGEMLSDGGRVQLTRKQIEAFKDLAMFYDKSNAEIMTTRADGTYFTKDYSGEIGFNAQAPVTATAQHVPSQLPKEVRNRVVANIQKTKISPREVIEVLANLNPSDVMAITEKLDNSALGRLSNHAGTRLDMMSKVRNMVNARRSAMPSSNNASPMEDGVIRKPVDRVAARVAGMNSGINAQAPVVNWDAKNGYGETPNQKDIDYFGFIKKMTPQEFRSLVNPGNSSPGTVAKAKKWIEAGEGISPPFLKVTWNEKSKQWQVDDHEGRSRTDAAMAAGETSMPVHIFPSGWMRARHITPEMKSAPFVPQKGKGGPPVTINDPSGGLNLQSNADAFKKMKSMGLVESKKKPNLSEIEEEENENTYRAWMDEIGNKRVWDSVKPSAGMFVKLTDSNSNGMQNDYTFLYTNQRGQSFGLEFDNDMDDAWMATPLGENGKPNARFGKPHPWTGNPNFIMNDYFSTSGEATEISLLVDDLEAYAPGDPDGGGMNTQSPTPLSGTPASRAAAVANATPGSPVGRPDLATPAGPTDAERGFAAVADEEYTQGFAPETVASWKAAAAQLTPQQIQKTVEDVRVAQIKAASTGAPIDAAISPEFQIAAMTESANRIRAALASGNQADIDSAMAFMVDYRNMRADIARALAAATDQFMTPAQRRAYALGQAVTTLPADQMKAIVDKHTDEGVTATEAVEEARNKALKRRISKIKKEIEDAGFTMEEVFSTPEVGTMTEGPAAAAITKGMDEESKAIIRDHIAGVPEQENAKAHNATPEKVGEVIKKAKANVDELAGRLADAGYDSTNIDEAAQAGTVGKPKKVSKAKAEAARLKAEQAKAEAEAAKQEAEAAKLEAQNSIATKKLAQKARNNAQAQAARAKAIAAAAAKAEAEAQAAAAAAKATIINNSFGLGPTAARAKKFNLMSEAQIRKVATAIRRADKDFLDHAYGTWFANVFSHATLLINLIPTGIHAVWRGGVQQNIEGVINFIINNKSESARRPGEGIDFMKNVGAGLMFGAREALVTLKDETSRFNAFAEGKGLLSHDELVNLYGYRSGSLLEWALLKFSALGGTVSPDIEKVLRKTAHGVGWAHRIPLNINMAVDDVYRYAIAFGAVEAIAKRIATSQGLTGKAFDDKVRAETMTMGSRAWELARRETQRSVFTTPLPSLFPDKSKGDSGVNSPGQWIGGAVGMVDNYLLRSYDRLKARQYAAETPAQYWSAVAGRVLSMGFKVTVIPFSTVLMNLLSTGYRNIPRPVATAASLAGIGKHVYSQVAGDPVMGLAKLRASKEAEARRQVTNAINARGIIATQQEIDDQVAKTADKMVNESLRMKAKLLSKDVETLSQQITAWTVAGLLFRAFAGDDDDEDKWFSITGTIPRNKPGGREEAAIKKQQGIGPYTIKIGDYSFNYGRIDPFAYALGTMADAARNIKKYRKGDIEGGEIFADMFMSQVTQVNDKSMMRGAQMFLDVLQGKTDFTTYAAKQTATMIVPNMIRRPIRDARSYDIETLTEGGMDDFAKKVWEESWPVERENDAKARGAFGEVLEKAPMTAINLIDLRRLRIDPALQKIAKHIERNPDDDNVTLPGKTAEHYEVEFMPGTPKEKFRLDREQFNMHRDRVNQLWHQRTLGRVDTLSAEQLVKIRKGAIKDAWDQMKKDPYWKALGIPVKGE